jgi:hypothetical protein
LLNLYGSTDMSVVAAWNATFDNISEPIEIRLEKRYAIIESIAGGKVRVKDRAERVVISPEFITELVRAGVESGLQLQPDGVNQVFGAALPYNTIYNQFQGASFDPRVLQTAAGNGGYKPFIGGYSRYK